MSTQGRGRVTTASGSSQVGEYAGWRLTVAIGVLVFGTLALRTAWVGFAAWPALLGAGLLGLAGLWVVRRVGVSAALSVVIAVVVPLLLLVVIGRSAGRSLLESVTNSFPSLLTSAYPAPAIAELLAPGVVLAWTAGALLGIGLSAGHAVGPPLGAMMVLLVSADLLTAGRADGSGLIGLALVALLLIWCARVARPGRGRTGGVVAAAILGVLSLLLGFLPLGTPFQPRDLVRPPVVNVDEPNPLPMLGRWALRPDDEVLRRTGDSAPLRLVVLPDYDGVSWGSESAYLPLGTTEQPALPPGRFQVTVETAVSWRTTTRWMPTPGRPVAVTVPNGVAAPVVDIDTGSLLLPELPSDGPVTYSVTGRVDAARLTEVEGAGVGEAPRYLALPVLPPEFVGYAREVTAGSQSYLHMAQALERAVASGRSFDSEAPGGSSLGRLSEFLFSSRDGGGRTGTSEQFATAYAVLARSVGLPTRVVVGFGDGEPIEDDEGTRVVRGRDALAWPEVYFTGYGWVPFDPTPNPDGTNSSRSGRVAPHAPRTDRTARPAPPRELIATGPAVGNGWWPGVLVGGVLIAGPTVGFVARRRRAAAQRELGTIGAWHRIEDAIVLAGLPTDRTRGATDRAAALGVPAAEILAARAETAAFAPGPVPAAPESWGEAEEVVRRVRATAPPWRRAVWAVSPAVWRRT